MHPHPQVAQSWAVLVHSQGVWGVQVVQGLETEELCWSLVAVRELLVVLVQPFRLQLR